MPISGSSSYVPVTRDFLSHWLDANGALDPAAPLLLPAGTGGIPTPVTRADLEGLLEASGTGLIPLRAAVESKKNDVQNSSAELSLRKSALLARLVEFNAYVRTWYEGTKWTASLAQVPSLGADESNFTKPLDDALAQWAKMEDEMGAPIVLMGDYAYDTFDDDIQELRADYAVWSKATQEKKMAIQSRKAMEDRIYPVLKKYREVVVLRFAKDSPVYLSMPRLSPLPGHTPAAVVLTGIWDEAEVKALLGWTASTELTLKHYQIRYCTGPEYVVDEEEILATIPKDGALTYLTDAGLSLPGAVVSFKVYVVLESDNQKGSDAVTVTRPA